MSMCNEPDPDPALSGYGDDHSPVTLSETRSPAMHRAHRPVQGRFVKLVPNEQVVEVVAFGRTVPRSAARWRSA